MAETSFQRQQSERDPQILSVKALHTTFFTLDPPPAIPDSKTHPPAGAHEVGKLDELLELFIKKYVQCHACGNPETQIKIRKDNIHLMCKACGNKSNVDMRHRLNVYILKNPPEDKLSKAERKCV